MNDTAKNLIIFLAGVTVGVTSTYIIAKNRYEQIMKEDRESMRDTFSKRTSGNKADKATNLEDDMNRYIDVLHGSNYAVPSAKEDEPFNERPYVISPDEFDEMDSYETISLTYYADGVLTDDCDELVEDVDDVVGLDSLNHFGEYEDDSVFVRNDRYKCDYEILKDRRKYSDVVKSRPHPMEDE